MLKNRRGNWPKECAWPEPHWNGEGSFWEVDWVDPSLLDEDGQDLVEIREYFDSLVEEGVLNEDYSLNEEYEFDDEDEEEEGFVPEMGEQYWDNGFVEWMWDDDFSRQCNLLKIASWEVDPDPVVFVRGIIEYEFVNENLLRQAFTRRAFAVQYGIEGYSEELEFLGDSVLNVLATRVIVRQLMWTDVERPEAPFGARRDGYDEGVLSKIRSKFVCKEYLAGRAEKLGLDQFILYGGGEQPTESSREDMMEALIGAVAVDSDWNWDVLEGVVDRLLCIQLTYPDEFLKATYYDVFNAWHQKHFGCMPSYEVYRYDKERFACAIRFSVPDNDKGIRTSQRFDIVEDTRSEAREKAALRAYAFVVSKGLWLNLREAGIVPNPENSINQLQELYQKKYVEDVPQYEFEQWQPDRWNCYCTCGGLNGFGQGSSKVKAKKEAAYEVLVRLYRAAGIPETPLPFK